MSCVTVLVAAVFFWRWAPPLRLQAQASTARADSEQARDDIVALIAKGWIYALITLGLIIAVQQLEGHVLQPLVMGRAVSIHPLAVVLAIAAGGVLAGIVGALLAVPTVAFLNSAMRVLLAREPEAELEAQESEEGKVIQAEADDVELAKKND